MSTIATDYYDAMSRAFAAGPPPELEKVADLLASCVEHGHTAFTLGNGASAALAAHMACDLGKGTAPDLGSPVTAPVAPRLRIVSLPDNIALLSAYGNDLDYGSVFVEPLKNLLAPGDVVLAVSASGSSPNVLRAVEYARARGAHTVGFTGSMPSAVELEQRCDITVRTPLTTIEQIEDAHVTFHHVIALLLRERMRATP